MPINPIPKNQIHIPFERIKVKYKDIFILKEFYESLHEWLQEYNWIDVEEQLDHYETYYAERVDRNGYKELWVRWRPQKKAPDTTYLTYHLDINLHGLRIINTEIVREGQKIQAQNAELEIEIRAIIQLGYKGEFEKSFLKQLTEFFNRKVYWQTVLQREKELYDEVYALQNFIKQWFKMKRYMPYEETRGFFPSRAWPSHLKQQ